jgi:hypothetical protein
MTMIWDENGSCGVQAPKGESSLTYNKNAELLSAILAELRAIRKLLSSPLTVFQPSKELSNVELMRLQMEWDHKIGKNKVVVMNKLGITIDGVKSPNPWDDKGDNDEIVKPEEESWRGRDPLL